MPKAHYLQEFVQHVPQMLVGLLAKEVTHTNSCSGCPMGNIGRWRCRDCFRPQLMCCKCMCTAHQDNPLHHIEAWTGEFFRSAATWEIGCYVLIPHAGDVPPICQTLEVQMSYLETLQLQSDAHKQHVLRERDMTTAGIPITNIPTAVQGNYTPEADKRPILSDKATGKIPKSITVVAVAGDDASDSMELDQAYITQLDQEFIRSCQRGEDDFQVVEEESVETPVDDQMESDDPEVMSPPDALPEPRPYSSTVEIDVEQPRSDSLNNTCHGEASVPADLVAGGLLPTSFQRFCTFFTTTVLDDFWVSNLECKSSAYQYWNKLSRVGAPGAGIHNRDDFYRELRHLSRSWR
ncbi:hypothetical protein DXG01_010046, partial [Tephrocybe rancida]